MTRAQETWKYINESEALKSAAMYEVVKYYGKWAFKTPHGLERRDTKRQALQAAAAWKAFAPKVKA